MPAPQPNSVIGAVTPGGLAAALQLDPSGNLKVNTQAQGGESQTVTAPDIVTVGAAAVQLLAANVLRMRLVLQNVGTTVIYILFGNGTPSASNYHIALRAGGTSADGSSPPWVDTMWVGAVQAVASANGGACSVAEFTT